MSIDSIIYNNLKKIDIRKLTEQANEQPELSLCELITAELAHTTSAPKPIKRNYALLLSLFTWVFLPLTFMTTAFLLSTFTSMKLLAAVKFLLSPSILPITFGIYALIFSALFAFVLVQETNELFQKYDHDDPQRPSWQSLLSLRFKSSYLLPIFAMLATISGAMLGLNLGIFSGAVMTPASYLLVGMTVLMLFLGWWFVNKPGGFAAAQRALEVQSFWQQKLRGQSGFVVNTKLDFAAKILLLGVSMTLGVGVGLAISNPYYGVIAGLASLFILMTIKSMLYPSFSERVEQQLWLFNGAESLVKDSHHLRQSEHSQAHYSLAPTHSGSESDSTVDASSGSESDTDDVIIGRQLVTLSPNNKVTALLAMIATASESVDRRKYLYNNTLYQFEISDDVRALIASKRQAHRSRINKFVNLFGTVNAVAVNSLISLATTFGGLNGLLSVLAGSAIQPLPIAIANMPWWAGLLSILVAFAGMYGSYFVTRKSMISVAESFLKWRSHPSYRPKNVRRIYEFVTIISVVLLLVALPIMLLALQLSLVPSILIACGIALSPWLAVLVYQTQLRPWQMIVGLLTLAVTVGYVILTWNLMSNILAAWQITGGIAVAINLLICTFTAFAIIGLVGYAGIQFGRQFSSNKFKAVDGVKIIIGTTVAIGIGTSLYVATFSKTMPMLLALQWSILSTVITFTILALIMGLWTGYQRANQGGRFDANKFIAHLKFSVKLWAGLLAGVCYSLGILHLTPMMGMSANITAILTFTVAVMAIPLFSMLFLSGFGVLDAPKQPDNERPRPSSLSPNTAATLGPDSENGPHLLSVSNENHTSPEEKGERLSLRY